MTRLALALTLACLAGPVLAQQAPAPAATATAPARWTGLPVAAISERLTAAGLTVEAPQTRDDRVYLLVQDGALRWVVTLFSCTAGACPDVQFTAAFSGPNATPEIVSRWNAERRFVKAFSAAPETADGEPQAVAQYDILLNQGADATQLDDPIRVWRSLATDLGRTVASSGADGSTPDN